MPDSSTAPTTPPNRRSASVLAPAPAGLRIGAFLLDYLVIFVYLGLLVVAGLLLTREAGEGWSRLFSVPWRADLLAFLLTVLPVGLYFARFEAGRGGATWGKRRLGIRVVGTDGRSIGTGRALVRSGVKLLPWQMAHTAMLHIPGFPVAPEPPTWTAVLLVAVWVVVGLHLLGLTGIAGGRPLYDRLAGTVAVRAPEVSGAAARGSRRAPPPPI